MNILPVCRSVFHPHCLCSWVTAQLICVPWITAWKRTLSKEIKYGYNLLAQDVPKLQTARSVPGDGAGVAECLLCFSQYSRGSSSAGEGLVWHSLAGPVVTTHWSSQQGDSRVFLCHAFVLERGKGLRTAFNKGTQMFVFIAPPELIKILTFLKKGKSSLWEWEVALKKNKITDGIMKKDYFQNKLFGLEVLRKKISIVTLMSNFSAFFVWIRISGNGFVRQVPEDPREIYNTLYWVRGFVLSIWEGKDWKKGFCPSWTLKGDNIWQINAVMVLLLHKF